MRHYYHVEKADIAALPAQAAHEAVELPGGAWFCAVEWDHALNEQEVWEARSTVEIVGTLLDRALPTRAAGRLAQHGVSITDAPIDAVRKIAKKFGGIRLKL